MTTTAIATGTQVRYHGSITEAHGLYRIVGTCGPCVDCDNDREVWDIIARNHQAAPGTFPEPGPEPVRYALGPATADRGGLLLEHVRAESFTTTTDTKETQR